MSVEDFGKRWQAARGQGQAKGLVIAEMVSTYGWSKQTCYRKLAEAGFRSNKKKRSDAGTSSMKENDLLILSAMLQEGLRTNGKAQLLVPEARSIMAINGFTIPISNRQLNRLLKQLKLDMQSLKTPKIHSHLQSLHPNHVWQIDPSFCTIYYLKNGQQVIIEDSEAYKNKHDIYEKLKKNQAKVWRYVMSDHYSGYTFVRYYQTHGENQQVAFDFFLQAAMKKERNPLCGVPKIILWDKGSANTSKAMIAALTALGVKVLTHAVGKSNVKGSVENANNRVECSFETHLRFNPLHSVEEINIAVEAYFIAYNANLLPERDSRLERKGKRVRTELWLEIKESELRFLPELTICRRLLVKPAEQRTVKNDGCIDLRHTFYKQGGSYLVAPLGLVPGDKVQVQCLAYDGAAILVHYRDKQGRAQTSRIEKPLAVNNAGFIASAAVIGKQYKVADDRNEQNRKKLESLAHPEGKKKNAKPFAHLNEGQGLQTHNQIIATVNQYNEKLLHMPLRGNSIGLGQTQIYQVSYSLIEALTWLKNKLESNNYQYSKEYVGLVKGQMKEGKIEEADLEGIYQKITKEDTDVLYFKEA